ncbi:branched-chain amino acid ABC transporter permease [Metallumcola ferriviriculae]|uniref:Branched-chain amino acid ABC transporter permease n=1 Tax=Metallumcola ferriviriculae TaxID=3039180 RepID=A0AAU0UM08_9FIRM|nr:branched-chain amino acid ABC transporter permease [Desulfitibacteraceae bacterium MK1]
MDFLNAYYLQIITFVAINAILALSIYIPFSAGQLSLGNAGFMSIGAYTAAILSLNYDTNIFISIIAGALVAALVGMVLGFPALRLTGLFLAIATLGFGEVVRVVFLNLKITNGALGLPGIPNLNNLFGGYLKAAGIDSLWGLRFTQVSAILTLVFSFAVLAVCFVFILRQEKSRIGRAMAAIKADEVAAEVMGISTTYVKMLAFAQGAFLAGLAGALSAHITNFISPGDFGYHHAIDMLLFVVLGGSEVVWGGLLGAFIITTIPEVLRFVEDYRWILFGMLLVLMMAFRPQGIIDANLFKRSKEAKDTLKQNGEVSS